MDLAAMDAGERAHVQIEALKLAFADAFRHVADPVATAVPANGLLSARYVESRRALIGDRAASAVGPGAPPGDTAYVCTVDAEGNCCSLIHSVYMHFGANVVVPGTGIVLQNRGTLFSADPSHPNALAPGKRPFHTIIPAMVIRDGAPRLCFGVVGGYQQPQAQVQILSALLDCGASLADAVRAPRFRWMNGAKVRIEAGFPADAVEALRGRGHELTETEAHGGFGGAQAILIDQGRLEGASDHRKDGSVGFV
jgi:gamma-glutamyltranspeptidase/glutathione hydrolase